MVKSRSVEEIREVRPPRFLGNGQGADLGVGGGNMGMDLGM